MLSSEDFELFAEYIRRENAVLRIVKEVRDLASSKSKED